MGEIAKVRRSVWVAAIACGVLIASLVTFVSYRDQREQCQPRTFGAEEESLRSEDTTTQSEFKAGQKDLRKSVSPVLSETDIGLPATAKLELSRQPKLGEVVTAKPTVTLQEDIYYAFGRDIGRAR